MQENYDENIPALQYLKEKYSNDEIFNNEKIMNMVELNHRFNFTNLTSLTNSPNFSKLQY